eukprot:snap_masked-scaffold_2-processed-gene-8.28-mRNA-1 protein AED:1.00 eAED:1.00 QI:0/0/0/0/1/1/2/0/1283
MKESQVLLKRLISMLYNPSIIQQLTKQDKDLATKTLLTLQNHSFFLKPFISLLEPQTVGNLDEYTLLFILKTISQLGTKYNSKFTKDIDIIFPRMFDFIIYLDKNNSSRLIKETAIQTLCRIIRLNFVNFQSKAEVIQNIINNQGLSKETIFNLIKHLLREFSKGVTKQVSTDFALHAFKHSNSLDIIFQTVVDSLSLGPQQPLQEQEPKLFATQLEALIHLLEFDFIGNGQSLDNTSDESILVLYIPKTWGPLLTDPSLFERLFQYYLKYSSNISIRRSLYQAQSRTNCLKVLLTQTTMIMNTKTGLNSEQPDSVLHEFCRLLYTIKNHYQLVDLTQPQEYHPWLNQLRAFTCDLLNPTAFTDFDESEAQIIFYLMKLWSGIYVPVPYLVVRDQVNIKALETDNVPVYLRNLKAHMSEVIKSFIEFFIFNTQTLTETTKNLFSLFAVISRANLVLTVSTLTTATQSQRQFVIGNLLAVISALIGSDISKVGISVIQEYDACILQLCVIGFRVLSLFTEKNAGELSDVVFGLEFVKSFQRVYIESKAKTEAEVRSPYSARRKTYKLQESAMENEEEDQIVPKYDAKLGTKEQLESCVSFIFTVLGTLSNVKVSADDTLMILEECLDTFYEISVGVTVLNLPPNYLPRLVQSSTLLLQSNTVIRLLTEPATRDFPFLAQYKSLKSRSVLMLTLTKLLFTKIKDAKDKDEQVEAFLGDYLSLKVPLQELKPLQLACILRDWRGFIQACTLPEEFEYSFSFWFPDRINLLKKSMASAFNSNNSTYEDMIVSAVLKISQDMVYNKGSRMTGVMAANPQAMLELIVNMATMISQLCNFIQTRINTRLSEAKQKSDSIQHEILVNQGVDTSVLNNLQILSHLQEESVVQAPITAKSGGGLMDMEELKEAVAEVAGRSVQGFDLSSSAAEGIQGFKLNNKAVGVGISTPLTKLEAKYVYNACKVLLRLLDARILPFGSMSYYKDTVFLDALNNVLKVSLCSSPQELLNHTKTMYSLVGLFEALVKKRQLLTVLMKQEPGQFSRFIGFLVEVLLNDYSQSEYEYMTEIKQAAITCLNTVSTVRVLILSTSKEEQKIFSTEYRNVKSRTTTTGITVMRYGNVVGYTQKPRSFQRNKIYFPQQEKEELKTWFGSYEEQHQDLFPQVLKVYLGILFNDAHKTETQEHENLGIGSRQISTYTTQEKVFKLLTKGLLPLILTCPQTFLEFRKVFLENLKQTKVVTSWLESMKQTLGGALVENNGVVVSNPAGFEEAMLLNEAFAEEVLQVCLQLQN